MTEKSLKYLYFSHCKDIIDSGIASLTSLMSLEHLDISYTSTSCISWPVFLHFKNSRYINASYCDGPGDNNINININNLEHLNLITYDIPYYNHIYHNIIIKILSATSNLKYLALSLYNYKDAPHICDFF